LPGIIPKLPMISTGASRAYAERLNRNLLRAVGGDRFVPAPMRVVGRDV